jgi:hypothetical protein
LPGLYFPSDFGSAAHIDNIGEFNGPVVALHVFSDTPGYHTATESGARGIRYDGPGACAAQPSELMAFHRAEIVLVRPRSIPYLAARGLRARRTWATARTGGIGRSGLLRVVLRVGDVVEPGDELTVRLRVGAPSRFWHKPKHEAALVEVPPSDL